jgi:hypothetical protein
MAHKSQETLREELTHAASLVTVGGRYAHYKHPERAYTATGLGILEATEEVAVIYQAEYDEQLTFIRVLSSWLDQVSYNGITVPRFSKLD